MYKGAKYSCCSYNGGGIEADEGIFEIISLTEKQAKFKLIVEPIYGIDWKKGKINAPNFFICNEKKSKNKKEWLLDKEKYKKELEEEKRRYQEQKRIFILKSGAQNIKDFLKENKEFTKYIGACGIPFNFTLVEKKNNRNTKMNNGQSMKNFGRNY